MSHIYLNVSMKSHSLWRALREESGQDLVEYAAVIVLVVLALTGGMTTLAAGINNAMVSVGNLINTSIG